MANFENGYGFSQFPTPYMPMPPTDQLSTMSFVPSFTRFAPYEYEYGPYGAKKAKNNEKERIRTQEINNAFWNLQQRIPYTPRERLPRVKTIRLAVKYIRYLNDLLDQDDTARRQDGTVVVKQEQREDKSHRQRRADFAHIAASEIQAKNNYVDRATALLQIQQQDGHRSIPIPEETLRPAFGDHVSSANGPSGQ